MLVSKQDKSTNNSGKNKGADQINTRVEVGSVQDVFPFFGSLHSFRAIAKPD